MEKGGKERGEEGKGGREGKGRVWEGREMGKRRGKEGAVEGREH